MRERPAVTQLAWLDNHRKRKAGRWATLYREESSPGNDAAEDQAVCAVFGDRLACSSTKGFTGHTLGAAGGVEAVISILALQQGLAPASLNLSTPDPALHANVLREARQQPMRVIASNSFGFGGSNACLVFGGAR